MSGVVPMIEEKIATLHRPSKLFADKRPSLPAMKSRVILDMGEASREEGFRLNGCR